MKLFMFGFAALLVTGSVFAADAPNVIHDKVGFFVHLDVAKVLSSTDRLAAIRQSLLAGFIRWTLLHRWEVTSAVVAD